jgi:hypothetical protein
MTRVTRDVVIDVKERASDSRNTEKEVIIPKDANVRGYAERNKSFWTVLQLKMTALISFEKSRNVNPTTQRNTPAGLKQLNLQPHRCEKLKSCSEHS